jgi:hypothetical protein
MRSLPSGKGLKGEVSRHCSVDMRRSAFALLIAALFLLSVAPLTSVSATSGRSSSPTFGAGPTEGDVFGGTFTVVVSGASTFDAVQLDLWDGTSWSGLSNVTSADSWLYGWDSSTVTDGAYRMRMEGWLNGTSHGIIESGNFTVDNSAPSSLVLSPLTPDYGTGASVSDRAWYAIPSNGTLSFTWNASDANLDYASLTDVPGPGSPSNDGPGFLTYRWDWTSGGFPTSGTWDPKLTVYDKAGLSTELLRYIGIDNDGPTVGTPSLSVGSGWSNAITLTFSNLNSGATDSGGSGISGYEVRDSTDASWTAVGTGGAGTLPLQEGVRTIQFRAVDNVDNRGDTLNVTLKIDHNAPQAGGWLVPQLTTALTGTVDVEVQTSDEFSGIDHVTSKVQYGFDSDGTGSVPDLTGAWVDVSQGLSVSLSSAIDWSTKEGQYLSLRAVLYDNASNTANTVTQHFLVLPSLDLAWQSASLDRLVVRAGGTGIVNVTSVLVSNEPYSGSVSIRLQTAPADRNSDANWTTLETRTLSPGDLTDSTETLLFSVTILNQGEYDIRLVIDPDDAISERDEGNNDAYMVAQGSSQRLVGSVSSFAPTLFVVIVAGAWVGWLLSRSRDVPYTESQRAQ